MNYPFLERTAKLYGDAINTLSGCSVAVFGLGGVGGYCIEALARSGIGKMILIDNDMVTESNINRQIFATYSTLGVKKTEVAKLRLLDINPQLDIVCHDIFFEESTKDQIELSGIDYIVDAIDTINSKILIAVLAKQYSVPIISCMGTANKLNPSMLQVTDIFSTTNDPLARLMRSGLRKVNIDSLKVVFSVERSVMPQTISPLHEETTQNTSPLKKELQDTKPMKQEVLSAKKMLGSNAFVPASAGLLLAKEVFSDLINLRR